MTDYYVGTDGDNGAAGTSWATRLATFNGAEGKLAAGGGDTVYVGPGVYRMRHDIVVDSATPNTFIGDVSGANTDGVGGIVRLTGSDDDEASVRANCVLWGLDADNRVFQGFTYDMAGAGTFATAIYDFDNLIIRDCIFGNSPDTGHHFFVNSVDNSLQTFTIERCLFQTGVDGNSINIFNSVTREFPGSEIRNCIFLGSGFNSTNNWAIYMKKSYGVTITNCTFYMFFNWPSALLYAIEYDNDAASMPSSVYNSVFVMCGMKGDAGFPNELTEDYNVIMQYDNTNYSTDITDGGNTVLRAPHFGPPQLLDGYILGGLDLLNFAPFSVIPSLACNGNAPADDYYGITRPAADAQKTRGAIQYAGIERETAIVNTSDESISLPDAMEHQVLIPITGQPMKFSVKVYRETNYTGTLPQLIVKQPGVADQTDTDTGSVDTWNPLNLSFTPATSPPYVAVCLRSNNTATSGSFKTFWDTFSVK